ILPRLDPHFRMVLVAGLDRVGSALHIRPVLDGCHLLNSVFLPKTTDSYRRLRVPPHRCNLNGTTLNVAANDVFDCFDCLKSTNTLFYSIHLIVTWLAMATGMHWWRINSHSKWKCFTPLRNDSIFEAN